MLFSWLPETGKNARELCLLPVSHRAKEHLNNKTHNPLQIRDSIIVTAHDQRTRGVGIKSHNKKMFMSRRPCVCMKRVHVATLPVFTNIIFLLVRAQWPHGQCNRLRIEQSGFEP